MSSRESDGHSKRARRRPLERVESLVLGLALLLASSWGHAAAASDELSVVTYNVRALPAIITGDDSQARIRRIPAIASSYDVAVLQEAFEYRQALRSHFRGHRPLGEAGEVVAKPERRASLLGISLMRVIGLDLRYGAGLATFVADSLAASGSSEAAVFETCSGWLGGRYDCWAAKGAQCDALRLPSGVEIDVCNTHLDSGDSDADRSARAAQLDQLAAMIERRASPNPLLVVGDLNLSMSCAGEPFPAGDARLYERLVARLGLRDTGVCGEDRRWERLRDDFIFFRSGDTATLRLLEAGEDLRFTHAGEPLSDHPALYARFLIDPAEPTLEAGP